MLGFFPYQLRTGWDRQVVTETGQAPTEVADESELIQRVAATPGVAFGEGGEGHLRFVFKTGDDAIRRGVARIAEALARLPRSAGARPAEQCR